MTRNETWLKETLTQLRSFGDDTTLIECKRAEGGVPENLSRTICAFANMPQPGVIILGVDERRGFEITGVREPAKIEKAVVQMSRSAVAPSPQVNCTHLKVQNRSVVVVEVIPLLPEQKPATVNGVPYLRQADGDYAMNSNDLRMLHLAALSEGKFPQFDLEVMAGTDTSMLDAEILTSYLDTIKSTSSRLRQVEGEIRLLHMTGVIDAHGNIRRGGLYAMGFLPQVQEPALGATAAVRLARENGGGRNKNLVEIEGPVPIMLADAMTWVRRNTDTVSRYNEAGNLVDTPEFPPAAIREVIANALVHRDLGPSLDAGKKIEIRVTERALIVLNPGGLRGISVGQLESPALAKSAVNKRLYEMARNLRLPDGSRVIEGEGGGIQEILAALREARLPRPLFIDTGVEFKVVFPRGSRFSKEEDAWLQDLGNSVGPLTPIEEDLLVNLRMNGSAEFSRILTAYVPISERRLKGMLEKLTAAGLVDETDGVYSLRTDLQSGDQTTKENSNSKNADAKTSNSNRPVTELGKNTPVVYKAIQAAGKEGSSLREIQSATELSVGQIRYALRPLLEDGYVRMDGGQGTPSTKYRVIRR